MWILIWVFISYTLFSVRLRLVWIVLWDTQKRYRAILLVLWLLIAVFLYYLSDILWLLNLHIDWFSFHSNTTLSVILWYTLLAFQEEFLKFLSWWIYYINHKVTRSDIILFWILVALWFALGENIIYIISVANNLLYESTQLAISRGLTWFIWHAIFTWSIWYISYRWLSYFSWHSFFLSSGSVILGLIFWTWLHVMYNLILHYNFQLWFLLYLLFSYLFLTYLLYNSNRLYATPPQL